MLKQKESSDEKYLNVDRRYITFAFLLFVLFFFTAFLIDIFAIKFLNSYSGATYTLSYLSFLLLLYELIRGEKRRLEGILTKHCIQLNRRYIAGAVFIFSSLFFASALFKKSMIFTVFVGFLSYTACLLLVFVLVGGERKRNREVNSALIGSFEELPEIKAQK